MCHPEFAGKRSPHVGHPARGTEPGAAHTSWMLSWGMTIDDLEWPFHLLLLWSCGLHFPADPCENKIQAASGSIISTAVAWSVIGGSVSALQS